MCVGKEREIGTEGRRIRDERGGAASCTISIAYALPRVQARVATHSPSADRTASRSCVAVRLTRVRSTAPLLPPPPAVAAALRAMKRGMKEPAMAMSVQRSRAGHEPGLAT